MPAHVLIVDICGLVLAVVGFVMAFRQDLVRRILGRRGDPRGGGGLRDEGQDPLTYVLRIARIMIMVFGVAIGGMFTLAYLE